ncbi:Penicillin-binding protein PbpB [Corynebacterium occultum]|uniref:Penicillin-binding protein PbpB n=1 Tax=Corynebacterium occultum TaxID=2675219 RepID=A0A6B8W8T0_9CORY|nr:penicillin-binding transpeptidase domain-containing protein [Corynebacterium occultum]QGU07685.1 Penicillin-binding protein PbpB [Corynebacterium occultum]
MNKPSALLLVAGILGGSMVACTPKPAAAQPVAEEFLAALSEQDLDTALEYVDTAGTAREALEQTFSGLQAEGLHAEIDEVTSQENIARASYTLSWDLPRERELEYQSEMVLTRSEGEWTIRWQPSLVHPKLAANQHLELRSVKAQPASVVTSDGAEILSPGVVHRILVDTAKVTDPRKTAARVAGAVNAAHQRDESIRELDAAELAATLADASGTYSVMTIPQNQGQLVDRELADLPEVRLNEEAAMVSNEPGFARDIMARVGNIVSEELEGTDGWKVSTVTQEGATFEDVAYEAPDLAPAVTIGLDRDIQLAAEEAVNLRQDMKTMLVAIRPSTGQVLAVAQTEKADEDGNVALMGQYPPGSVFKVVTAAAGLQRQGLTPETIVPCPGSMDLYGRTVINYNMFSLGNIPLNSAFANSCNTTFADISTKLAPGELQDTGKQFGLGINYNIPGLDTVTGSIPEGDTPLDRTEAGYGQGLDLASPFGMALMSATVARGSTPVPSLIDGHVTEVSEEVPAPDPAVIEDLRQVMRSVVTSGTAAGMQAGGEIYGKTGEAEINEGSHAWFAGFRDDDIAFATLVVLGGGSETATAITDHFFLTLDAARAAREPGAAVADPAASGDPAYAG